MCVCMYKFVQKCEREGETEGERDRHENVYKKLSL